MWNSRMWSTIGASTTSVSGTYRPAISNAPQTISTILSSGQK